MGPQTLNALKGHLRALAAEGGVLVVASDHDRAGERYHAQLAAMAQAAGVRGERLLPPPDQDWNDVLRQGRGA
jgi:DNA primase